MTIKMTIDVSPEQAIAVAKLISSPIQTTPAAPAPQPMQTPPPVVPTQQQPITQAPVQAPPIAPSPVQNTVPMAPPPVQQTPPVAARTYTQDELALASRPICEMGRQQELLDLLHSFTLTDASGNVRNVQSIRELPEECYPAFANGIRALGGKI